jgi:DNA-binding CsgD family transcriptional regulator
MSDQSRASTPHPVEVVGREPEVQVIGERLREVRAGRGSLVLISGELGIGKTTLALAGLREAAAMGAVVGVGYCLDRLEAPPYGPWINCLVDLSTDLGLAAPPLFDDMQGMHSLTRATLFAEIRLFLARAAADRPIALFLDDIHWADQPSLDLLDYLARYVASLPILLLVAYRPAEVDRHAALYRKLPTFIRASSATIALAGLDAAAMHAFVQRRYPLDDETADRFATFLLERTEGNPLFAGEIARMLQEQGRLHRRGGGWRLEDLATVSLPARLRHLIDARLVQLGEQAYRLLATAAVIGPHVPLELWTAAAGGDRETVFDALDAAIASQIMYLDAAGARATFTHQLIREALYESILAPRRRLAHLSIAEKAMEQGGADAEMVAYHLRSAGDARAAEWLVRAGERAQRARAWSTAAARYEQALLVDAGAFDAARRGWLYYRLAAMFRFFDPDRSMAALEGADEAAATAGETALQAHIVFSRGLLHAARGEFAHGIAGMQRGLVAIDALDPAARAQIHPLDVLDATANWATVGSLLACAGRFDEARRVAGSFLGQAGDVDPEPANAATFANAYLALALSSAFRGEVAEASGYFERVREMNALSGHRLNAGLLDAFALRDLVLPYLADVPDVRRGVAQSAEVAWDLASDDHIAYPRGIAYLPFLVLEGKWREAEELARQPALALSASSSVQARAEIARCMGERDVAWSIVRDHLPDGPDTTPGTTYYAIAMALMHCAALLALDAGDLRTARRWIEAHATWLRWSGAVTDRAAGFLLWARWYRASGDGARAEGDGNRALAQATEPRQPLALIAAHRFLGELAGDRQASGAEAHFQAALDLAGRCEAPYERALTLLALGEYRRASSRRQTAGPPLEEARALLEGLGARPALARVAALEARGPKSRRAGASGPFAALSRREVEVLRLLSHGLSNAQIADALSISPFTVNSHLTRIYQKLAVPSRSAAIRYATIHGFEEHIP